MLTKVSETTEITVTGWGSCVLTLLLVGGGGRDAGGSRGGAGSGHLEYRSSQVSPGTVLTAQVGRVGEYDGPAAEASSVAFSSGDIITAQPGEDNVGSYTNGGAGYSGNNTISGYNYTTSGYSGGGGAGSSSYGGAGGTNGGNGEDGEYGAGGSGTGEDVSLYTFRSWLLTPGSGGQPNCADSWFGGGGGGLMVDGTGPEASTYQGQGYGGGANGNAAYGDGLQGLILLEIN